jgi:hypothetical protein
MFYRPFDLEQPSQFLSSSTDVDLLLVEIRGHDLGVLRPTDTVMAEETACQNHEQEEDLTDGGFRLASSESNISVVLDLQIRL